MDMQGQPIGNPSTGTKVASTAAPPVQEGPGAIAKDSLAAESSAFDDKYTQDVSGSASTFNNTDTSGASTLPPAGNASERLPQEGNSRAEGAVGQKYPEALGSTDHKGVHTSQGFSGAPSSDRGDTSGSGVYNTGLGSGGSGASSGSSGSSGLKNADPAPTYASFPQQESKPRGKNIKEGGFDSDAPNASFNTAIGTDQDPSRQAELDMQKDASDAAIPGSGRQTKLDTDHQYQSLNTDEQA